MKEKITISVEPQIAAYLRKVADLDSECKGSVSKYITKQVGKKIDNHWVFSLKSGIGTNADIVQAHCSKCHSPFCGNSREFMGYDANTGVTQVWRGFIRGGDTKMKLTWLSSCVIPSIAKKMPKYCSQCGAYMTVKEWYMPDDIQLMDK